MSTNQFRDHLIAEAQKSKRTVMICGEAVPPCPCQCDESAVLWARIDELHKELRQQREHADFLTAAARL